MITIPQSLIDKARLFSTLNNTEQSWHPEDTFSSFTKATYVAFREEADVAGLTMTEVFEIMYGMMTSRKYLIK